MAMTDHSTDRSGRRISITKRVGRSRVCWLVHRWGPWHTYELTRPVRCIGPSLRHVLATTETRRRRQCVRCGRLDDRLVDSQAVSDHGADVEVSSSVAARDVQT